MARTENQKRRLLCLLDLLYRETDADHRLSLAEMQAGLEKAGYSVERKALYDDLRALAEKCLRGREATVIRMRYGLADGKIYAQQEVADKLGISRSYVSRIEKKALERLKRAFETGN